MGILAYIIKNLSNMGNRFGGWEYRETSISLLLYAMPAVQVTCEDEKIVIIASFATAPRFRVQYRPGNK
jgi:hypothetical protein